MEEQKYDGRGYGILSDGALAFLIRLTKKREREEAAFIKELLAAQSDDQPSDPWLDALYDEGVNEDEQGN